ncbi:MAG TPA: TldD/PmbA family protein [Kofleriaceae bacterium]|nr:TldD/PmbA family protein [Kofleriaceae bacterium]
MLSQPEAKRLVDRVLTLARATKGAEAIVTVRASRTGNTRFAVNELSTSGDVERLQVALTVQFGQRSASAVINQQDDHAIDDLVGRVVRMARLAPESPELMPPLGRQSYVAAKNGVDPATAKLTPDVRARAAGAAIAAGDAAKLGMAGFVTHAQSSVTIGTSAGLSASHAWTSASMSCTARTPDGTGSGWAGAGSNRMADIDAAALAKVACDKATSSARARRLEPGRYTVVLEPAAVGSLLAFFTNALDARRADEGRSYFTKHRPGDKLFPETITLRSDPTDAGLGSQPFDADGFPLAVTKWIDKGTLTGLPYSRFWAKKQGKQPTGLVGGAGGGGFGGGGGRGQSLGWALDGGTATRDDLIKGVQRGVLITRFWYLRVLDPQSVTATGLTRDGVFLIENGQITHPVNNFRFNESPVQMLARADGLSATSIPTGVEVGAFRVPALRTHEFNLASISDAV